MFHPSKGGLLQDTSEDLVVTVPSTKANVAQTRRVLLTAGLPLGALMELGPYPVQPPVTLPLPSGSWVQH